jgi:hypothetical protein
MEVTWRGLLDDARISLSSGYVMFACVSCSHICTVYNSFIIALFPFGPFPLVSCRDAADHAPFGPFPYTLELNVNPVTPV